MNIYIISVFLLVSVQWTTSVKLESVQLVHYYGPTSDKNYKYSLTTASDITKKPEFIKTNPTVFYAHGYQENMGSVHINLIIDSYLKRKDSNLIIIDWTVLSNSNYLLEIVPNIWNVSIAMADVMLTLLNDGLDIQKLHLVGFSVGSHMAGLIGRHIQTKSSKKFTVKRITALDPAYPLFYPNLAYQPINKNDAEFVDVIHTDAGLYGTPIPSGTVDFWPNGGYIPQPGCRLRSFITTTENDMCTHRRAYYLWAESIANKDIKLFNAIRCTSWDFFKYGWCEKAAATVNMGIDTPLNIVGNYYLQTNGNSPFSKGTKGTTYAFFQI